LVYLCTYFLKKDNWATEHHSLIEQASGTKDEHAGVATKASYGTERLVMAEGSQRCSSNVGEQATEATEA
jgi:hypothetical protein